MSLEIPSKIYQKFHQEFFDGKFCQKISDKIFYQKCQSKNFRWIEFSVKNCFQQRFFQQYIFRKKFYQKQYVPTKIVVFPTEIVCRK